MRKLELSWIVIADGKPIAAFEQREHAETWAVQRAALRPGVEYVVRLRARLSGVGATQPERVAEIDVVGPWN